MGVTVEITGRQSFPFGKRDGTHTCCFSFADDADRWVNAAELVQGLVGEIPAQDLHTTEDFPAVRCQVASTGVGGARIDIDNGQNLMDTPRVSKTLPLSDVPPSPRRETLWPRSTLLRSFTSPGGYTSDYVSNREVECIYQGRVFSRSTTMILVQRCYSAAKDPHSHIQ